MLVQQTLDKLEAIGLSGALEVGLWDLSAADGFMALLPDTDT